VFRRKKNVIYTTIAFPLVISILLPVVLQFAGHRSGSSGIPAAELVTLLPSFTFYFLIIAGYVPTTIASYSLVGEKVEKSLEPLLATPTTDGEILLGKGIAAFLPPIAAILGTSAIFMALSDLVTHGRLGYYFFPNLNAGVVFLLMVPLAAVMSVEGNVIISSRVSDVRTAQQLGALMILPFAGIYVGGELGLIDLGSTTNLLIIAGILMTVVVLLLYVAKATFRREEILTKWK
jgi:ABC-type Na+ efflux pump permease subunit